MVKLPKAAKRGTRVTLTHDGESNFIVRPLKTSGKAGMSVVNEIGTYQGTRLLPSGTKYLEIDADGAWTVKVGSITPGSRRAAGPSGGYQPLSTSQWGLRSSTSHPTGTG